MDKLAHSCLCWTSQHILLVFSTAALAIAIFSGQRSVAEFHAQPVYAAVAARYQDENNIDAFAIGFFEVLFAFWLPGLAVILISRTLRRR